MLIDSHCHLDFPDFAAQLPQVLERAAAAGVGRMMTIGTYISRFPQVHAVAMAHAQVFCSMGLHPLHAAEDFEHCTMERLRDLAQAEKVVAVGECGLDYFYSRDTLEQQQETFRRQIRLCLETQLPIVIHSRDAEEDTMRILQEEAGGAGLTGVLHCFTGSDWLADRGLEFGLHIGLSGILTFKNSTHLRSIAARVPADRYLVETDAPYLAPVPYRGKTNEPSYVASTAKFVAEARGVPVETVAAETTANFLRLCPKVLAWEAAQGIAAS